MKKVSRKKRVQRTGFLTGGITVPKDFDRIGMGKVSVFTSSDIGDTISYRSEDEMGVAARLSRKKISTTISPRALAYLESLIKKKEAPTLAEAIDLAIARLNKYENRERLENDTALYFDRLSTEALAEEDELATALAGSARGLDVDREP